MNNSNSAKRLYLISASPSQDDLWRMFRGGDRSALGKIYRQYIDDLYHYGMHFCRDSERVKDCLQDLFGDLWMDREHLSPAVKNIRHYLLSSLRRRLLRSMEKDRRHRAGELALNFDFEIILSNEDLIIENEYTKEQSAKLQKALASLSRRQREVVYLRFYQNLSYSEIADLMSMQVESVYNLISKAIGALKNMFLPFLWLLLSFK